MQECHGFAWAAWPFWHEAAERACPHTLKPYATHRAAAAPTQSPTATAKQQLEHARRELAAKGHKVPAVNYFLEGSVSRTPDRAGSAACMRPLRLTQMLRQASAYPECLLMAFCGV